jgi:beta-galactosidase GanA
MVKLWLAVSSLMASLCLGATPNNQLEPFTYNDTTFFFDGKPMQILGGQMDPHRVPREAWRDRIKMARAMGLNTLFAYIYWDQLEPEEGKFDFSGNNDLSEYFKIAQEEGLYGGLRMGPYICGEHEWGGYPYWLNNKEGLEVRTNDPQLADATKKFFQRVYDEVEDQLASNGGNIFLVQVENEYGSYGNDMDYKKGLRDMALEVGFDVPLYTTDGTNEDMVVGGNIPNVLAEVDGHDGDENAARLKYLPDQSTNGPFMNAEYYTTWIDHWAADGEHQFNDKEGIEKVQGDLTRLLNDGGSFSLYMFHGGTNWGFQSGSNWDSSLNYQPTTTSYDYGAPLDESGRPTDLYHGIRQILIDYLKNSTTMENDVPDVPDSANMLDTDKIQVKACSKLLDNLGSAVKRNTKPLNMEAVGQGYGYIDYRKKADKDYSGQLTVGDKPRDRVLVYVNGERKGLLDARFGKQKEIKLDLKKGDHLDLLVENLGRVNFAEAVVDQVKGIVGDVKIGDTTIQNWDIFSLDFKETDNYVRNCNIDSDTSDFSDMDKFSPTFFTGTFNIDDPQDTFLAYDGWTKGVVWVNGHNLGRYWTIGPQQQLYLPKAFLKKGENKITVLELVSTSSNEFEGVSKRSWYNNPDPEA